MITSVLVSFAPLLALPLLPLLRGPRGQWLLVLAALLPAAVLIAPPSLSLPSVMLGSGIQSSPTLAWVIAALALLFALALAPVGGQQETRIGPPAFLLLAQGALTISLVASDLLLMLSGFTVASYAVLAGQLGNSAAAPGRLRAAVVLLVLGDLAAFELALLFAKTAENALAPQVSVVASTLAGAPMTAAFALLAAGSRGGLLLLAGPSRASALPAAALTVLFIPALGWRLEGLLGAVTAAAALAGGVGLFFALAAILNRYGTALINTGQRVAGFELPAPTFSLSKLPEKTGLGEWFLGRWGVAISSLVVLILLILAATTLQAP